MLVELNPSVRLDGAGAATPRSPTGLNEITFEGALQSEKRAIAFVQDLVEKGTITGEFGARLKVILVHSINDEPTLAPLGAVSKFNIEPDFLKYLFNAGRTAAIKWWRRPSTRSAWESSIDIRARFL